MLPPAVPNEGGSGLSALPASTQPLQDGVVGWVSGGRQGQRSFHVAEHATDAANPAPIDELACIFFLRDAPNAARHANPFGTVVLVVGSPATRGQLLGGKPLFPVALVSVF